MFAHGVRAGLARRQTKPIPRRRAKPIPGAERSQSAAPTEANPRAERSQSPAPLVRSLVPSLRWLRGEGVFPKLLRIKAMARIGVLCPTRGSHTSRDHGADRHALPETTLPLCRAGRHRLPPTPSRPQATVLGLYSFGIYRGPAMRAQQRGHHHPGRPDVGNTPSPSGRGCRSSISRPRPSRGVGIEANSTSPPASPLAGLGPQGLAVDPPGAGPRRHLAWATASPCWRSASLHRRRAIPVAWKVLPGNVSPAPGSPSGSPSSASSPAWSRPGSAVLVMTDRGLYARWLYREIVAAWAGIR